MVVTVNCHIFRNNQQNKHITQFNKHELLDQITLKSAVTLLMSCSSNSKLLPLRPTGVGSMASWYIISLLFTKRLSSWEGHLKRMFVALVLFACLRNAISKSSSSLIRFRFRCTTNPDFQHWLNRIFYPSSAIGFLYRYLSSEPQLKNHKIPPK